MLDREHVIEAFLKALGELGLGKKEGTIRPRAVAVRAHEIYCGRLPAHIKRPSAETFRKFATGRLAIPEVVERLEGANVQPVSRARLDRDRLKAVFQEAIQRMEARLFKRPARPLQIARRAHEIYVRETSKSDAVPSHYTFQRLIYGKAADPEILKLIEAACKGKA
jgi:hypothetical protein